MPVFIFVVVVARTRLDVTLGEQRSTSQILARSPAPQLVRLDSGSASRQQLWRWQARLHGLRMLSNMQHHTVLDCSFNYSSEAGGGWRPRKTRLARQDTIDKHVYVVTAYAFTHAHTQTHAYAFEHACIALRVGGVSKTL